MSDPTPILNPNTPLAYLDPVQAYQTSVAIYVLAGSAGVSDSLLPLKRNAVNKSPQQVLIWDVLDNISADFKIIFKSRFTLSTAAFIGSRYL